MKKKDPKKLSQRIMDEMKPMTSKDRESKLPVTDEKLAPERPAFKAVTFVVKPYRES